MPIPEHCAKVAFCRNYDIMFFKKPEMLIFQHFRLFLFLVCF